jgi:hypothetical protein
VLEGVGQHHTGGDTVDDHVFRGQFDGQGFQSRRRFLRRVGGCGRSSRRYLRHAVRERTRYLSLIANDLNSRI